MKKSLTAIAAALFIAALAIPVFSGCSARVGYILKTDEEGNSYYSVSLDGSKLAMGGEVVIPAAYGEQNLPVKEIEASAFSNTSVTKVTIPASIEKIGDAAFAYNKALQEVVFEEGIRIDAISWGLFGNCPNLKSVTVPDSVTTIDGLAFYGCGGLENIDLPAGLMYINTGAFNGCTSLKSVELPEGLVSIGGMAFYGCTSLKSVILPDSMHSVTSPKLDDNGDEVKDESGNTETVTTPALGAISFFNCTSLELAVLGSGITAIEAGTFGNCVALRDIYLPSSLLEVGGMFASGDTLYGHTFFNVKNLTMHYAGTEEEWGAVKIDDSYATYGDAASDNKGLIEAVKIFGDSYQRQ